MKQILWTLSLGLATSFIACSESATSVENNNEHESLESFTDSRDNREYKKVTIDEQTWMAENLYFEKYFYTWEEAKKACPEGWHLPNDDEWKILFVEVGGVEQAGLQLKSTSGWETGENGKDKYGFEASPMGYRDALDERQKKGYRALFWSATELDSKNAYNWRFDGVSDYVFHEDYPKNFKLSVRCIENNISEESSSSSDEKLSSSNKVQSSSSSKNQSSSSITKQSSSSIHSSSSAKSSSSESSSSVNSPSSSSTTSSSSAPIENLSSSSSSIVSSSSEPPRQTVYDPIKKTLTDGRDGHVYRTTTINNRVWMAENLDYAYYFKSARSFCYQNDTAYCTKYGRLYTWSAAMDSAGAFSNDSKLCGLKSNCKPAEDVRGMCPEGWHLPNRAEWNELFYYIGGYNTQKLKAKQNWDGYEGSDDFGFSILSAGVRTAKAEFANEKKNAYFWTSDKEDANVVVFDQTQTYNLGMITDDNAYSIRCLMNYEDKNIPKPDHEILYGTLEDSRDGNVYKTVEIGEQTWMAENLRFEYHEGSAESSCPKDNPEYCKTFGRLYTWSAAIDSAGIYSNDGIGCGYYKICNPTTFADGICPEGYRLPNEDDFLKLREAAGGETLAGQNLKGLEGWPRNGNGYNLYGFNATPISETDAVYYWSSSEKDNKYDAIIFGIKLATMNFTSYSSFKSAPKPIRCIKRSESEKTSASLYIKDESSYDASTNTLTDYRDNKIYKTVKIGDQIWMAENLDFDYNWGKATSQCAAYSNDSNCQVYGRLYNLGAAIDSSKIFSDDAKGCGIIYCEKADTVRGACPRGWHLPSVPEWEILIKMAGDSTTAGYALRSTSELWGEHSGSDSLGFAALPAGFASDKTGTVSRQGEITIFHTSTWENQARKLIKFDYLTTKISTTSITANTSTSRYSIRCIKDAD